MAEFVRAGAGEGGDEAQSEPAPALWEKLQQLETDGSAAPDSPFTELLPEVPVYTETNAGDTGHFRFAISEADAAASRRLLVTVAALTDDNVTPVENALTSQVFLRRCPGGGPAEGDEAEAFATAENADCAWDAKKGYTRDGERFLTLPLGAGAGGVYTVAVAHLGATDHQLSYRVSYSLLGDVPAEEIAANATVRGENGAGEMTFYRYTHAPQEGALITVHARPVTDGAGEPIGDPDLYISNVAGGLFEVTRDRYVWKSCNVGADRVDIHPRDSAATISNGFLIGILGYRERNVFEVEVKVTLPKPIEDVRAGSKVDFAARPGEYKFFRLPVDAELRSQLRLILHRTDDAPRTGGAADGAADDMVQTFGRGIYTLDPQQLDKGAAPESELRPVMYISSCIMYPTEGETHMRAAAPSGPAVAIVDCEEWKYNGDYCFVGVTAQPWLPAGSALLRATKAAAAPAAADEGGALRCRFEVVERPEILGLPEPLRPAFETWKTIFGDVDGGSVSQHDRTQLDKHGNSSFTYGEVEFVSFAKILSACDVRPGETFVDLGSGTGKALYVAAMGGYGFDRCVGIELLPGLHQEAVALRERVAAGAYGEVPLDARIDLLEADMTREDWPAYADVLYASSICFTEELMAAVGDMAKRLKPGARFCTLKVWPGAEQYFDTVHSAWFKMSWGRITVYVLKRKAH